MTMKQRNEVEDQEKEEEEEPEQQNQSSGTSLPPRTKSRTNQATSRELRELQESSKNIIIGRTMRESWGAKVSLK